MSDPKKIEIYIVMNEDGDYEADIDKDTAVERLNENCGGEMLRIVRIETRMSPPELVEVTMAIPDEVGTTGPVEAA